MIKYGRIDEAFDSIVNGIEDEVDCAILNDEMFNNSLKVLGNPESMDDLDVPDAIINKEGQPIDSSLDYSEVPLDHSIEDVDANDLIAADRDLSMNPVDDDDIDDDEIEELMDDDEVEDLAASDDDLSETEEDEIDLDELADE